MFVNAVLRVSSNCRTSTRRCLPGTFCRRESSNVHPESKLTCHLEKIESRSFLKVSGKDCFDFLQGLITNDIRSLKTAPAIYAMFLNNKGRILYDAIIYRTPISNELLIECDSEVKDDLEKHMKMYCIRKKVEIEKDDENDLWVVFYPKIAKMNAATKENIKEESNKRVEGLESYESTVQDEPMLCGMSFGEQISWYKDPRLGALGARVISSKGGDICQALENGGLKINRGPYYQQYRYKLGVPEGRNEMPPGECFPLEMCCDYLQGVSFQKGCYLGQEVTARTHHTGVVRKRIMPLTLREGQEAKVGGAVEVDGEKKVVGKVRGVVGTNAIAVLRVVEALSASALLVNSAPAKAIRPHWWPSQETKAKSGSSQ